MRPGSPRFSSGTLTFAIIFGRPSSSLGGLVHDIVLQSSTANNAMANNARIRFHYKVFGLEFKIDHTIYKISTKIGTLQGGHVIESVQSRIGIPGRTA